MLTVYAKRIVHTRYVVWLGKNCKEWVIVKTP
jgi:hypothetical protein